MEEIGRQLPNEIPSSRNRLYLVESLAKRVTNCPQTVQTITNAIGYPPQCDSKALFLWVPLTDVIEHGTQLEPSPRD